MSITEIVQNLNITGWFCVCVFLFLLICTVLAHLRHFGVRIGNAHSLVHILYTLQLIPSWSFFGPNPGVFSYRILAREFYGSNRAGQWREIFIAPPRLQLFQCLWNPYGRVHKALIDVVNELIEVSNEQNDDSSSSRTKAVQLTIPYIKCLVLATQLDIFPTSTLIQFAVVQCYKDQKPEFLLLSTKHLV